MRRISSLVVSVCLAASSLPAQNDWPAWGRDAGNQRHSPLKQINPGNVSKLTQAWSYSMKKEGLPSRSSQSTPLMVGGILYLSFPYYRVVALEPETGKILWEFTGAGKPGGGFLGTMRGMAYWTGDKQTPPQIVVVHIEDAKQQPPEDVRDNMRLLPGEGVIDLNGFLKALKKIGYEGQIQPEPLSRFPAGTSADEVAKQCLAATLAVMKKAGLKPA